MFNRHLKWWKSLAVGLMVLPTAAKAGSLIPWPWRDSGRYQSWKQSRDEQNASWYADRAQDPVGARQFSHKGKDWPPYPRPRGPEQRPTHIYHAAHYWPYPYYCDDRRSVFEYTTVQEDAGWVAATTLYDYHFDIDQEALNRAGRLQLRWILENVPSNRRTIFVQAGANTTASQLRMASVQLEATEMVGDPNVPPIILRITRALGRPAQEVDRIQRAEVDSQPLPRISPPFSKGGLGDTGASEGNRAQ